MPLWHKFSDHIISLKTYEQISHNIQNSIQYTHYLATNLAVIKKDEANWRKTKTNPGQIWALATNP